MSKCYLCPRMCGADRAAGELGFCTEGNELRVSRAALHLYEEPPISGERGSGTIFFSGCSLRCVFCQNKEISRSRGKGETVTVSELAEIMLRLQGEGAHNINLVTPTHFADKIAAALTEVAPQLNIPVVYNTSGYERAETLRLLDGLIDIYMPDLKYAAPSLAAKYSAAPNYPEVVEKALTEMYRQVGKFEYGEDKILKRGLIVRHLVLPSCRKDSMEVLDRLASLLPPKDVLLSLMSQYTPEFYDGEYKELCRRITSFEYESVLRHAESLGFEGFMQSRDAASSVYTPDF